MLQIVLTQSDFISDDKVGCDRLPRVQVLVIWYQKYIYERLPNFLVEIYVFCADGLYKFLLAFYLVAVCGNCADFFSELNVCIALMFFVCF